MEKSRFSETYVLTAGESDANGRIPPTLVVERMIEAATLHANALGIGYQRLLADNLAWVLSRISYSLTRSPRINEEYTLTTWIESWNRLFSNRCFLFRGGDGEIIGGGHSVWAAIDIEHRTAADLTVLAEIAPADDEMVCPTSRPPRLRPIAADSVGRREEYRFAYTDLDFNRHVNSVRYIERILNLWPLSRYDREAVAELDIAYHHECLFGQLADLLVEQVDDLTDRVDIICEGQRAVSARLSWTPTKK